MTELPECDGVLGLGANGDIVEAVRRVMGGEKTVRFPAKDCWSLEGDRLQTCLLYTSILYPILGGLSTAIAEFL